MTKFINIPKRAPRPSRPVITYAYPVSNPKPKEIVVDEREVNRWAKAAAETERRLQEGEL